MDVTQDRQMKVRGERGEKGKRESTSAQACGRSGKEPEADPTQGMNPKARLYPDGAADHVLGDDGGGHDEAADEYATWIVHTEDGKVRSGRIEREDARVLVLRGSDALEPPTEIEQSTVIGRRKSLVSNMPAGTVNVLHKEELLDLLAYLINGHARPPAE